MWWIIYDRGFHINTRNVFVIILSSLIISASNIYWNYANDFVTVNHTVSNADLSEIVLNYSNVIDFVSSQLLVFGPIVFLIYISIVFDGLIKNKKLAFLVMLSLPILLLITIQSSLKIANPNWAVSAYVAASLLISSYLTLNRSKFLALALNGGILVNIVISAYILKVTMFGSFAPINLKSDPLRKNLGFEILANKVDQIIDERNISKVVFERRGDITRFNYYLNKDNNKYKDKIFIITKSLDARNFYEANYNFKSSQNFPGDKILIVKDSPNLQNGSYEDIDDIKFIKSISSNTVKDLKRIYYLFEGTYS